MNEREEKKEKANQIQFIHQSNSIENEFELIE